MKMRVLFTLLIALFWTSTIFAGPPSDAEASRLLAGPWKATETAPEDGVFMTFKPEGIFSGDGTFNTPEGRITIKLEGSWRVEGGILIEKITRSSHPQLVPVGLLTRDTLMSVTDKEYRYRTEDGRVSGYIRRPQKPAPVLKPNEV